MTLTPIIDSSLLFVRIWITQLGIGLPESGGAYLAAAEVLDEIADTMAANLVNAQWEGQSASGFAEQGAAQWNSVTGLEKIDQEIATVIAAQADLIIATRKSLSQIETYLREARLTAETMLSVGQLAEAEAYQWAVAANSSSTMKRAMQMLNTVTAQHTSAVLGVNEQLEALLATLISEGTPTEGGVLSAVNAESAGTLRRAASIFRVDLMSLKDVVAFCTVTKKWLSAPAVVASGISRRVGQTHGCCTEAFTDGLRMFEMRRAEVIQKLREDLASRAALLEWTGASFELTDEETAALLQEASVR
ncbi:MAG: hypothetical protein K2Q25_05400 [Mycobacteriaceae bacterium]|nr:hypothetical protein [Mycobacteriaceae bacterium]